MSTEPFIWPPKKGREPAEVAARDVAVPSTGGVATREADRESAGRRTGRAGRVALRGLWRVVEDEFLDVTSPALRERLQEAGVGVDAGDVYCWRCGYSIGPFESDGGGCGRCRELRLPWRQVVRLGSYVDTWAHAVHEVKYTRFGQLGHDLGVLLGQRVRQRLVDAGVDLGRAVVVPVPMSFRRRLARGIDHPRVIARGVADGLGVGGAGGVPLVGLLTRGHRPSQTSLTATERQASVRGSMTVPRRAVWRLRTVQRGAWRRLGGGRNGAGQSPATVILVDDVTTTGATLKEACRAMRAWAKSAGMTRLEVVLAVVAVTEERKSGVRSVDR